MSTLLNSFVFAQNNAFVSGFEHGEMHEYLLHLVNRSADVYSQKEPLRSSRLKEVIFIDIDKIVDEQGVPCTNENLVTVLKKMGGTDSVAEITKNRTGLIGSFVDGNGNTLDVVAATDFIKNEVVRGRSIKTTAAGYLHYLLSSLAGVKHYEPLSKETTDVLQRAYAAVVELTGNNFPVIFEEITAGIRKRVVDRLLTKAKINTMVNETPNNEVGQYVGGGYGLVPAANPHVSKELGDGDAFLVDFTSSIATAFLMVADVGYVVKLTLKHQPGWIERDHFSNVCNKEVGKHFIIYIKYDSTLDIVKFVNTAGVRFTPGRVGDECHFGTFRIDDKQYDVRTVTPDHTGFMEDLYNMADTNAELVYVGLHLMYLLQENVVMGKFHEVKQLYLAFNAIEQLTGKPFHEQEWLLKHLGHKRFDALKLRHQYNFPI